MDYTQEQNIQLTCPFFLYIVISGALTPIEHQFHLTPINKELVVGATTFGAIFGGFFAGLVS